MAIATDVCGSCGRQFETNDLDCPICDLPTACDALFDGSVEYLADDLVTANVQHDVSSVETDKLNDWVSLMSRVAARHFGFSGEQRDFLATCLRSSLSEIGGAV